MTEKPTPPLPFDGELAESTAGSKRRFEARVAEFKRDLAEWLDANPSHDTAIRIALLETALDRYLAERTSAASDLASAAADATDMIQAILRRAVQRRRAALRFSASRTSRASGIPASDEELANRLTEILNLLHLVAEPLPKDAALRRSIDHAADPLGTLLGYFAGGIDRPAASHKTVPREAERRRPPPGSALTPAHGVSPPSPDVESPSRRPVPYEVEEWS
jgi:hypothetical protein